MELAYLSRSSPQEMAAVNFTLDESRQLHAHLQGTQRELGDACTVDLLAAMAELHEFDGNLVEARARYRSAIHLLDKNFQNYGTNKDQPQVGAALTGTLPDQLRILPSWALTRLRLLMLLGLCYEREHNLDCAAAEYREAQHLADRLLDAWGGSGEAGRRELLSHSFLLFQPFFALAWVFEKTMSSVDTSIFIIDSKMDALKRMSYNGDDPNIHLMLAEAYNRAGDLAFYKGLGRQRPVNGEAIAENSKHQGYLLHAHRSYARALVELRSFLQARHIEAALEWNILSNLNSTFHSELLPEFPAIPSVPQ